MKFLSTLAFSLAMITLLAQHVEIVHPSYDHFEIEDMIINENNEILIFSENGILQYSHDNAATWSYPDSLHTEKLRHGAAFSGANSNVMIIAGVNEIYRSTDSGKTWSTVGDDVFFEFSQFAFTIDENSMLIGDSDLNLLISHDTGESWETLPYPGSEWIKDVDFLNEDEGFAMTIRGTVWKTADGGMSWDSLFSTTETSFNLEMLNASDGYIFGRKKLQKTMDAWQNWESLDITDFNATSIKGAEVISPTEMYAIASAPTIYRSTDDGLTWEDIDLPNYIYNSSQKLKVKDDGAPWVTTTYKTLAKRISGTNEFIDVFAADKHNLRYTHMLDDLNGFAGGSGYNLLKTSDGGHTWTLGNNHGPHNHAMAEDSQGNLYYCRGYGGVYKSTDSGANWNQSLSAAGFIETVQVLPNDKIIASNAQVDQSIYTSVDAGNTWSEQAFPLANDMEGIYFRNATEGYFWTEDSIAYTADGGQNWSYPDLPRISYIQDIDFVNDTHGWIVGRGFILKTIDGGQNWAELPYSVTYPSFVIFLDEERGYTSDNSGNLLLYTQDGGDNWTTLATLPFDMAGVTLTPSQDAILIAGTGGSIYRIDNDFSSALPELELNGSALSAFPNPGTSQVSIQKSNNDKAFFTVINSMGQVIETLQTDATAQFNYKTSSLDPGLYYFILKEGQSISSCKWLKK